MTTKTSIYQQINSSKSAQQAQKLAFQHIDKQIEAIKKQIAEYKKIENPHWGDVGDLTHTIELLEETLAFLNNEDE